MRVGSKPVKEDVVSVGPYTASMLRTKKVFAVVHSASVNSVGFKFKGLEKDNVPRYGDVVVFVTLNDLQAF